MRIQIESTDDCPVIDGVETRRWKGVTENGVECEVFVHRLAVRDDRDCGQFEAELLGRAKPDSPLTWRE